MNTFFSESCSESPRGTIKRLSHSPKRQLSTIYEDVGDGCLSSPGNIHHPELQNDFEKNSKENAIQKAINCANSELLLFSVPQEKIDNVKPDSLATRGKMREGKLRKSSSATTIDQAVSSSAGNVHHPELQTELKNIK